MSRIVLKYNGLSRALVSLQKMNPLQAVRVYAMLSTVQYKVASKDSNNVTACLALASRWILEYLFPQQKERIEAFTSQNTGECECSDKDKIWVRAIVD